ALRAQGQGGRGRLTCTSGFSLPVLLPAQPPPPPRRRQPLPARPSPLPARAQTYPARTITLTVTAAAGGVTDVVARALGQRLAEAWGQQVVIENKGGAAHVVGAQSVAKAAPDGYSLLVAEAGTFTINPTLYGKGKLPYDEANPDHRHRAYQPGAARPSFACGRHGARADRARQSAAGRTHLRHRRDRIGAAHEHGAIREHGRREAAGRALSRRRSGAHRRHGGARAVDVGQRQPGL